MLLLLLLLKSYVKMNDEVKRETMRYLEVWMERQRNERNRVDVVLLSRKSKCVLSQKGLLITTEVIKKLEY